MSAKFAFALAALFLSAATVGQAQQATPNASSRRTALVASTARQPEKLAAGESEAVKLAARAGNNAKLAAGEEYGPHYS